MSTPLRVRFGVALAALIGLFISNTATAALVAGLLVTGLACRYVHVQSRRTEAERFAARAKAAGGGKGGSGSGGINTLKHKTMSKEELKQLKVERKNAKKLEKLEKLEKVAAVPPAARNPQAPPPSARP